MTTRIDDAPLTRARRDRDGQGSDAAIRAICAIAAISCCGRYVAAGRVVGFARPEATVSGRSREVASLAAATTDAVREDDRSSRLR
ncbi:MAG: hypothetical protein BGO98_14560 [Myxococcales bacterium 68-20]|nr:hypothetical protein [Myxococcales bacterium]OJY19530.1 MAG: hypothetical protein BGO98_14560 [Myxococcales bacterium 68-20]